MEDDLRKQKVLETSITAKIKNTKGLAGLEKKVLEANDLHTRIQANLQQLNRLERKPHRVKYGPVTTSMHYYLDEEEVGKIDLLKSSLIIFWSELDRAVFHKPPPPLPLPSPASDIEVFSEQQPVVVSPASDSEVFSEQQLVVVVDSEGEDVPGSKEKRRRAKKTYASKNQRSRLVCDKENGCWIPKWLIVWTSIDKSGRHKLNHFNLDIDKGGHTTVSAANTIHRS